MLRQVVWSVLVVELFLLYNNHPLLPPDSPQVSRPAALMRQTWKTDIGVYGCVFWLLGRVKEKGRKNAAKSVISNHRFSWTQRAKPSGLCVMCPWSPRFSFLFSFTLPYSQNPYPYTPMSVFQVVPHSPLKRLTPKSLY